MNIPPEVKPALWGAAGGAVVLALIGFTWGGWHTASSAKKLAKQEAGSAVVAALVPVCVDNFGKSSDASTNLSALKNISSLWEQGRFIEKGGWATFPGGKEPNSDVASECAGKLTKPAAAK